MTPAEAEWARCKGWIASALPFGGNTHSIEDIERGIADGHLVFVAGEHCAVVLEVVAHPNFKVLDVFLGGGEKGGAAIKEYCTRMDPYIEHFARQEGCKMVRHFCRPGSEGLGKRLGYRKLSVVMIKEISP